MGRHSAPEQDNNTEELPPVRTPRERLWFVLTAYTVALYRWARKRSQQALAVIGALFVVMLLMFGTGDPQPVTRSNDTPSCDLTSQNGR